MAESLPKGILQSDLKSPRRWRDLADGPSDFELWFTPGFGWCIPTLGITSGQHRYREPGIPRTYAVRVSDGGTVRIGAGPHVTARLRVYVRKTRLAALQRFLDLRQQGAVRAHTIRDRISTRRAVGQFRRIERGW